MRRPLSFVIIFFIISQISNAQIYTWNGSVSADYQDSSNWTPARSISSGSDTLSFIATSSISVLNVPRETIGAIQIASGTATVMLSTNIPSNVLTLGAVQPLIYTSAGRIVAGDFLTIELSSASNFSISSGVFGIAPGRGGKIRINGSLTLSGGTLDFDVTGTGGTVINGPAGSITYNSGIFSCTRASSITWGSGANYYHGADGSATSAIPFSTWQTGSTCYITGFSAGTIAPTGFAGITFANFTWNCPSQTDNIILLSSGSTINISGILSVVSTGGSTNELQLAAGKATIKAGSYQQTGGNLALQAGNDTTILSILGNFSHTGGVLNGVSGAAAGTAIVDLKGNVVREQNAIWRSAGSNTGAQLIFQFSANKAQSVDVSRGSWEPPAAGRCNIIISNTDIINGINLTGILRVYNTSNSLLPATLTMNGILSGTKGAVTYTGSGAGGTSLIYSGSFFQTAGNTEFPGSDGPLSLRINNKLGVIFPADFNRSLNGTLFLQNGNLGIGDGDTLSLTNLTLSNQLNYTAGFVTTGTLGRYFPTSGLPTAGGTNSLFPFGSGANNRFLNVFFSSASLSGGTAGMIYVNHTPIVDAVPISLADNNINPITLDKRTNTSWTIGTVSFDIGSGATVSIKAEGANIGAVSNYTYLRLTDGVTPNFGRLIATIGGNSVPIVGKSGLSQADLNKTLYIGSDSHNPLIIITFTWTGLGSDANWTTAGNWTGGIGYPSASTEKAIISSTSGNQPVINAETNIEIYQLAAAAGTTLTMTGNAAINIYDSISFNGSAVLAATSTFGYASSAETQYIPDLPYGNLALSGTAQKILPPVITITGSYTIAGLPPDITTNSNTFVYAGTGAQFIAPGNYYNLTITGDRGGQQITLAGGIFHTIDIKNVFDVSSLTNNSVNAAENTVNFSGTGQQTIPGFYYNNITNSGNGPRTLDPLGHSDAAHVVTGRTFDRGSGAYTIANSKVNFYVSGTRNTSYGSAAYYDLTISGDLKGYRLEHSDGAIVAIGGTFNCTVTNFTRGSNNFQIFFNGTGDQTIIAFRADSTTNTPRFTYNNISILGGNRNVFLGGEAVDTIGITGNLLPERNAYTNATVPFAADKGFVTDGSTVDFSSAGSIIPLLKPVIAGGSNYHNVVVSSGTRIISENMIIGGDLTVSGTDAELPATLTVGSGNSPRTLKVLGNLSVNANAIIP